MQGKDKQIPIGARVHIKSSGKYQMQELNLSRGYLSSVSPRIHFGIGNDAKLDEVVVEWPDGNRTEVDDLSINEYNEVVYKKGSAKIPGSNDKSNEIKQFETIVQNNPFVHKENPYDDFKDEILLPHKNSTLGPALAVGDLNNDSKEDYIIGGAIAQAPGIFIQQKDGSFKKINIPNFHNIRMIITPEF